MVIGNGDRGGNGDRNEDGDAGMRTKMKIDIGMDIEMKMGMMIENGYGHVVRDGVRGR